MQRKNGSVIGTLKSSGITRVIVIPDLQVPAHDKKSLAAVEKLMADFSWDYYINLGDFLDFNEISFHNHGKPMLVEGQRILKSFDAGNEILDRHQKIVKSKNRKAKFVLLNGNHDYRIERYVEMFPQTEGLLDYDKNLRLKQRKIEWVRCYPDGTDFVLGKAHFHHGLYTNDVHSKKHVNAWGTNIFYGHLHDVQNYSMTKRGENSTIVGQSLGCLCEYEQSYIKGNPSRWQQAVTIFEFFPNGNFTYNVIRIFNHQFIFAGKLYKP